MGDREIGVAEGVCTEGSRSFSENHWIQLIQQGSSETRAEHCLDNKKSLCYLRAIQGHSGGVPIRQGMMEYTRILYDWKEYLFHRGLGKQSRNAG